LILLYINRLGAEELVGNLTVNGFWLAYAGALLAFGFLKDLRAVRIAGLAITGLSIIKVALYDLTQLEALYRVASFFLLALMALGAAYAYHRRGRDRRERRDLIEIARLASDRRKQPAASIWHRIGAFLSGHF
jgi:uncharacterized membrane protein